MRFRIGGILAFAILAPAVASSCATSGVSGVYMANDSGGLQHRNVFYSDSADIYCIAKFSAGNPDSTLDFTIVQTGVYPWCGNTSALDTTPSHLHPIFAVGEQVPGVGVETVVAQEILPEGVKIEFNCNGYCTQNSAGGKSLCDGPPEFAGSCDPDYSALGPNTCGPGATCCLTDVPGNMQMGSSAQQLPYPVGTYTCVVQLDGVQVGTSEFTIIYPETLCPVPPPITGVPCYQWFPEGSTCPSDIPGQCCKCEQDGAWECYPNPNPTRACSNGPA
jgi:hypothetical protein